MTETICNDCGYIESIKRGRSTGKTALITCTNCQSKNIVEHKSAAQKTMKAPTTEVTSSIEKTDVQRNRVKVHDSLQMRFAIVLIALATFIVGGFIFFEYSYTKKVSFQELEELALNAATRMSKYLVEPLWGIEEEQLSESLISEMLDKQIHSIMISDADTGEIIIGKARDKNGRVISMTVREGGTQIISKQSITRKKDIIGDVEVVVTQKYALEKLNTTILKLVTTTILLYCAILATVFFILRNFIIKPITLVTAAADRISLGELESSIEYAAKNEIGSLVDAINRMQASLNIAFKMLNQRR